MASITQEEFIANSIKAHGSNYTYEKVVFLQKTKPVIVTCNLNPEHGDFLVKPWLHMEGRGVCSLCRNRGLTTEQFIATLPDRHRLRYDYSKTVYKGVGHPITITCSEHGDFKQDPHEHKRSQVGCSKCTGRGLFIDYADLVAQSNEVHGKGSYTYKKQTEFPLGNVEIPIRCNKQGHGVFYSSVKKHLYGHLGGSPKVCPRCSGYAMGWEDYHSYVSVLHENKYDYSLAASQYTIKSGYIDIVCPVEYTDNLLKGTTHGVFNQTASEHWRGTGCPTCAHEGKRVGYPDLLARFKEVHGDRYEYPELESLLTSDKVNIYCRVHNNHFLQLVTDHLAGSNCPSCAWVVTKPHQAVIDSVSTECLVNDRRTLSGNRELDCHWVEGKVAVEINGVYWHRGLPSRQHLDKTLECTAKGIHLFQFWDYEVINRPNVIASMINNKLGLSRKLHARKMVVDKVSRQEAYQFLDDNHLFGSRKSPCKLSYVLRAKNGRIAALMTFSQPDSSKNHWELVRFCNHIGLSVVGGANRLLQAFIRHVKPSRITSYADLRYSTGDLYRTLGFKHTSTVRPRYQWVSNKYGKEIVSRRSAQRSKLPLLLGFDYNPNLSERENMELAGYQRLWDCGNLTFTWTPALPTMPKKYR